MSLLALSVAGCALEPGELGDLGADSEAESAEEGVTATQAQSLYVDEGKIWEDLHIPVCWEKDSTTDSAKRALVKSAATETWQRYSHVRFKGWGQCEAGARGIRIYGKIACAGPDNHNHTTSLGDALDGDYQGMVLYTSCIDMKDPASVMAFRRTVTHEFGHALGFAHEHNRDQFEEQQPNCTKEQQGTDDEWWNPFDTLTEATAYDRYSIMNYCDESRTDTLSSLDKAGLRKYYWSWQAAFDAVGSWRGYIGSDLPENSFAASNTDVEDLALADFNADGISDVFYGNGSSWNVSWSGKGSWDRISGSSHTASELKFGQFTVDWTDDVFRADGTHWMISSSGSGPWEIINSSAETNVGLGDFNGDGWTDVFRADGDEFKVSWEGRSGWQVLKTSSASMSNLAFADFNGDGKTDVFYATGEDWYVTWGGSSLWEKLNGSNTRVSQLVFADINGDKKADVIYMDGSTWRVSYSGTGAWTTINTTSWMKKDVLVGNFDGDAKADIFRTRYTAP